MARQLLILLFSLFFTGLVSAETASEHLDGEADAPAVRVVRAFYTWYNECSEKMMDYRCADTARGRRYVHSALRRWLINVRATETAEIENDKAPDYFWKTQYVPSFFAIKQKYTHQVVVSEELLGERRLHSHIRLVTLKREGGGLKIIRVEDVTPCDDWCILDPSAFPRLSGHLP